MSLWKDRQFDKKARDTERTAAAADRNPRQQLQRLDFRLGKGTGAKRERARLTKRLDQVAGEEAALLAPGAKVVHNHGMEIIGSI